MKCPQGVKLIKSSRPTENTTYLFLFRDYKFILLEDEYNELVKLFNTKDLEEYDGYWNYWK